ncbi:hypothetical protein GCM10027343_22080 [Noviherbaspirillum agri]
MGTLIQRIPTHRQGAAIIEFALVLTAYLLLLLGTIEMGRALFTLNSAAEATRLGARLAVVTRPANFNTAVVPEMRKIMPALATNNVDISLSPAGCTTNCEYLEVKIRNYSMSLLFWPATSIDIPEFRTTLPVESLGED